MGTNWLYVCVKTLLEAYSKYDDWQSRTLTQFSMLLEFLVAERLLLGDLEEWKNKDIKSLRILASDLTEEGKALFSPPINAYFKWLKANDRDTRKPISMRSLVNGLKKVREQKPII
ncbi:MAG: hypothetical protein MUE52_20260 [Tabrizicola sp.]|jgi:hypothetical protein|nr:hypothetical protein [Tabrizicola sp.]